MTISNTYTFSSGLTFAELNTYSDWEYTENHDIHVALNSCRFSVKLVAPSFKSHEIC